MSLSTRLGIGAEFDVVRAILEGDAVPSERGDADAGEPNPPRVGPGDDAAVLHDGTVVSTDVAVENVHFRLGWIPPGDAGERAARAALSDIAAMGARPTGVFVNLTGRDRGVLVEAGRGVRAAADRFGVRLLGGDVAATAAGLSIGVTVLGTLGPHEPWARSGARPGDAVWVTGALGAAGAAVEDWLAGRDPEPGARTRFAHPIPRVGLADAVREHLTVHAAIDLSDGLAADARHVAAASDVALIVEEACVPVASEAESGRSTEQALDLALTAGEDYELLLVAAPGGDPGPRFEAATGVRLTRVGRVAEGAGAFLESPTGERRPLEGGFGHRWRA